MNVTIFFRSCKPLLEMIRVHVQMDEIIGRVCLFQMDDLERDTKLEGCNTLPGISDW